MEPAVFPAPPPSVGFVSRKPPRWRWFAAVAAVSLFAVALALWTHFGSAVFVDALGAVVSCF
jgi:hypothetical protein